ncbi:MAG: hypothetical protein IPM92_03420 [Saprospiraceae bacterium]|nr:hypothetical protein [Saprospiraceae bacterium]
MGKRVGCNAVWTNNNLKMNNEKWTLLFTAVVSISTVVYAILTWALVRETSKMRKNLVEPYIIAYLDNTEIHSNIIFIKTKNIGQGVALNVKFRIIKELNLSGNKKLNDYHYFRNGVKYFPPGHLDKHFIISYQSRNEPSENDTIILEVDYATILNEKRMNRYELNLLEIFGKGNLRPPDTHLGNIGYRLEMIEKLIEKYVSNNKG